MRKVKIDPMEKNQARIVLDLIREKYRVKKITGSIFPPNPTEFFRKMK